MHSYKLKETRDRIGKPILIKPLLALGSPTPSMFPTSVSIASLGKEARRALEPFASSTELDINGAFTDLGYHEGIGVLLLVGKVDLEGRGTLTLEQTKEFANAAREFLEHVLAHISVRYCMCFIQELSLLLLLTHLLRIIRKRKNMLILSTLIASVSIPLSQNLSNNFADTHYNSTHVDGFSPLRDITLGTIFYASASVILALSALFAVKAIWTGISLYSSLVRSLR